MKLFLMTAIECTKGMSSGARQQRTWPSVLAKSRMCILASEVISQSLGFLIFLSVNE